MQAQTTNRESRAVGEVAVTKDAEELSDSELVGMVAGALPTDAGLTPLKGFDLDLSANPGFRKVFFSIRCDCGTAGVLSVEVAPDKGRSEVEEALPSLVDRLASQARGFRSMPCEMHLRMRMGPAASR